MDILSMPFSGNGDLESFLETLTTKQRQWLWGEGFPAELSNFLNLVDHVRNEQKWSIGTQLRTAVKLLNLLRTRRYNKFQDRHPAAQALIGKLFTNASLTEACRNILIEDLEAYCDTLLQWADFELIRRLFPAHIVHITKLVEDSVSVIALLDANDYGSFRDYKRHRALVEALKIKGASVKLIVAQRAESMSSSNKFCRGEVRVSARKEFRGALVTFCARMLNHAHNEVRKAAKTVKEFVASTRWEIEGDVRQEWGSDETLACRSLWRLQFLYQDQVAAELIKEGVDIQIYGARANDNGRRYPSTLSFVWIGKRIKDPKWVAIEIRLHPGRDAAAMLRDEGFAEELHKELRQLPDLTPYAQWSEVRHAADRTDTPKTTRSSPTALQTAAMSVDFAKVKS